MCMDLCKRSHVVVSFISLPSPMTTADVLRLSFMRNQIGSFGTNNGGEYMSNEFKEHVKQKGINQKTTILYTPKQNGVTE